MLYIMDVKLTLKLDQAVIEKAKKYAAVHKKSLSRLIEAYLKALMDEEEKLTMVEEEEISPYVKSMKSGVKLPDDFDYKKERLDYLTEKYK